MICVYIFWFVNFFDCVEKIVVCRMLELRELSIVFNYLSCLVEF